MTPQGPVPWDKEAPEGLRRRAPREAEARLGGEAVSSGWLVWLYLTT